MGRSIAGLVFGKVIFWRDSDPMGLIDENHPPFFFKQKTIWVRRFFFWVSDFFFQQMKVFVGRMKIMKVKIHTFFLVCFVLISLFVQLLS